jgi:hypothetical protein
LTVVLEYAKDFFLHGNPLWSSIAEKALLLSVTVELVEWKLRRSMQNTTIARGWTLITYPWYFGEHHRKILRSRNWCPSDISLLEAALQCSPSGLFSAISLLRVRKDSRDEKTDHSDCGRYICEHEKSFQEADYVMDTLLIAKAFVD